MKNESLESALNRSFKKGVGVIEARHVCIALYCSADYLPTVDCSVLNKSNIVKVFSELARAGVISDFDHNNSKTLDTGYWLEQIDEALKSDNFYDKEIVMSVLGASVN